MRSSYCCCTDSIILLVVFRRLQPRIGFGWVTRVIRFIVFATQPVSVILLRFRSLPPKPRSLVDKSGLSDLPFLFCCSCLSFNFAGAYDPIFYLPVFAFTKHITSQDLSFYTISIISASSIIGRIVPAYIADRWLGYVNVLSSA